MTNRNKQLTLIALFPALLAVSAGIIIPLGSLPPITLQTFFVFLAALILPARQAFLSILVYILIGMIGLPVYSGYTGGIGIVLSKSAGFFIGFLVSAYIINFMKTVKIINNEFIHLVIVLIVANLVIYVLGAGYLAFIYQTSIWLYLASFLPYLVGDFIKIIAAVYVHVRIRSHVTYEWA
jgi:biotin transport system substrate-specific component